MALAQVCGWEFINQGGTIGGPRTLTEMVYNPPTHSVILFGGGNFAPLPTGTWSWNGQGWSAIFTQNTPPARSAHAMAAKTDDSATHIVLYGGDDGTGQNFSDTWTFDGTDWTLHPGVSGPPALEYGAMVYHETIAKFVHFGGSCPAGCFADTFTWNGSLWSALFTANAPPPRYLHAMAYDPIRAETVLYGGNLLPQNLGVAGDTWVFDGTNWTQRVVTGPPPLVSHSMAFDATRGTVVMHGGLINGSNVSNQTWEWNGSQWSLVGETQTFANYYHQLVFDGNANQLLLLDISTPPNLLSMNWSSGPVVAPVTGTATGAYPCPLTLGISATGGQNLSYQWYKDNSPLANNATISGVTTDTLTINPTSATTAGSYRCQVTDSCATVNSGTIVVTMRCLADVNMSGTTDPGDFTAWIAAFNANDIPKADQNCDGLLTPADFTAWIANYNAGC